MARIPRSLAAALLAATLPACAFGMGEEAESAPDAGAGGGLPPSGGGGTQQCEEMVDLRVDIIAQAPDVLLALDRSSSMGQPTEPAGFERKWDDLLDAIDHVTTVLADRIYLGVMLVPSMGETCGPGVIDIAPAVDSTKNMKEFLESVWLGGGTPLATSINNARAYFASAPVNPHGRYVLLATDGAPNCDSTGNAVEESRTAIARLRQDGIRTFVVGYAAGNDAAILDQLAAAGGTGSHFAVTSAYDLASTLEQITSEVSVVSCEYQLERGPDLAEAMTVTVGGQEVPHDPSHQSGWDYDPDTRMLTFYGEACDALRTSGDADIGANYCGQVD